MMNGFWLPFFFFSAFYNMNHEWIISVEVYRFIQLQAHPTQISNFFVETKKKNCCEKFWCIFLFSNFDIHIFDHIWSHWKQYQCNGGIHIIWQHPCCCPSTEIFAYFANHAENLFPTWWRQFSSQSNHNLWIGVNGLVSGGLNKGEYCIKQCRYVASSSETWQKLIAKSFSGPKSYQIYIIRFVIIIIRRTKYPYSTASHLDLEKYIHKWTNLPHRMCLGTDHG